MAVIYKDRWQVELFFKAVQQNLRLKTFVGTSSDAVCRQVWTAQPSSHLPTKNPEYPLD